MCVCVLARVYRCMNRFVGKMVWVLEWGRVCEHVSMSEHNPWKAEASNGISITPFAFSRSTLCNSLWFSLSTSIFSLGLCLYLYISVFFLSTSIGLLSVLALKLTSLFLTRLFFLILNFSFHLIFLLCQISSLSHLHLASLYPAIHCCVSEHCVPTCPKVTPSDVSACLHVSL